MLTSFPVRHALVASLVPLLLAESPARAGDVPLYQPVPAWVTPPPALDPATFAKGAPVLVLDAQIRLENGTVSSYADSVVRVDTPEALTQLGTLTSTWFPDKGDLIVHRAVILRGAQEIDLLAAGNRLNVLKREARLERRVLDGMLTATMPVAGLQVGDVLRFSYTVTGKDTALGGRVQDLRTLPVAPTPVRFTRLRVSWPAQDKVRWRATPDVDVPADALRREKGDMVLTLALPLPKRRPLPDDAPTRFRHPPMFQSGTFADWVDVSRTLAPLFAPAGTIAPGSPLAAEVDAIAAATTDPRDRAARALQLVQSRISYLLLGMNGGNYVPQSPQETWTRRYGDCKAKTLLLLAMLDRLGIRAEAALVSSKGGDTLPTLLPMAAAFDHVIVHAQIGGKDLWLDGTSAGARLADLDDVPGFVFALPLRPAGADLMRLAWRKVERPDASITIAMDERAGIDLPALVDVTARFKGPKAATLALAAAQATPEKLDEQARAAVRWFFPDITATTSSITADAETGIATVRLSGLVNSPWRYERAGARHVLEIGKGFIAFSPDRARPAWKDLPVAVDGPAAAEMALTLQLPEGGKDYRLEGATDFSGTLAGALTERHADLADGVAHLSIRQDSPAGAEIAPADVSSEKARVAQFIARGPFIRAPRTATRFWERAAGDRTLYAGHEAAYAAAIAKNPDKARGYAIRARFRRLTGDRPGAYADYARALELEPTIALYSERAQMLEDDGKYAAALADMAAAQDIEPANHAVAAQRGHLMVKLGRPRDALALRDEELDAAGNDRVTVITRFAEVQADAGDVAGALAALDQAAEEKPGNPEILNLRCWLKGTRQVALDTALKDCTRAIELADVTAAALDSRAMVYFRLGRLDEALDDLNAALDASPGLAGSLFMRGVIEARTGKAEAARADIAGARAVSPGIDRQYANYGITAPR